MSLYMMMNYLGNGIGQFMMLIGDPAQFQFSVIASMVYSFALVPIILTHSNAPRPLSQQRTKFRQLFAISPVGVFGTICAGVATSSFNSMGAVFAREAGLSVSEVSLFMATAILWGMILQFPLGRLSDRFDRLTVLVISAMDTAGAAYGVIWTVG